MPRAQKMRREREREWVGEGIINETSISTTNIHMDKQADRRIHIHIYIQFIYIYVCMFECQMNYTLTHKNKTFGAGCKDTSIFIQI